MKIYFTCSTAEFLKYKDQYYAIRNFLVENNHVLTRDWLDKANRRISKGQVQINDIKEIYQACRKAISEAEVVIIEDTVSNFSTGHQITLALQWKKPTLILWSEPKHRHFEKTFIQGIDSEFLEVKQYNSENLEEIIRSFINKFGKYQERNRFNLVLSDIERNYLDWAQHNKNISRTKLIRKAIRTEIEEDEEYRKYLINSTS